MRVIQWNKHAVFKTPFKVETNWQCTVVIVVFSITGMGAVFIARPMMGWVGIKYEQMPWYTFWPLCILCMTICYQIMLVIFGTLAGQRVYFW
jgi:hypothetical protein